MGVDVDPARKSIRWNEPTVPSIKASGSSEGLREYSLTEQLFTLVNGVVKEYAWE